jgi:hypothetical protein
MGLSGTSWQATSNQLVVREGGGCLGIFGLPFFGAGVFLVLVGIGVVPMENAAEVPTLAWPVLVAMGLVFAGVGGGLAFGRRWTTLDTGRSLVLKQWGLLVPLRTEEQRLGGYEAVLLRRRSGDSDSADQFDVLLKAGRSGGDLPLSSSALYGESRELAGAAARLLNLPLVDGSTPLETVIPPGQVDQPLQERLRPEGETRRSATRPFRMQSQVRESWRGVEIFFPAPGFRLRKLLGPALSVGALAYIGPRLLQFFRETGTPEAVQMAFMGFLVFLFLILPLLGVMHAVLFSIRGGTVVTVSREGIAIEERKALGRKLTHIPAADILGLDHGTSDSVLASVRREAEGRVVRSGGSPASPRPGGREPWWVSFAQRLIPSQGIVVKTRSDLVTFGAGLPDEEVLYLHAVVARALGVGG